MHDCVGVYTYALAHVLLQESQIQPPCTNVVSNGRNHVRIGRLMDEVSLQVRLAMSRGGQAEDLTQIHWHITSERLGASSLWRGCTGLSGASACSGCERGNSEIRSNADGKKHSPAFPAEPDALGRIDIHFEWMIYFVSRATPSCGPISTDSSLFCSHDGLHRVSQNA